MNFWETLYQEINHQHKVVLMYVIHSEGSSPGRQGFKMGVSDSGLLFGSIGGGFMEHKLVELCKKELLLKDFSPFAKRQIHQASVPKDKSGMICSGEQTIAFYRFDHSNKAIIESIVNGIRQQKFGVLALNEIGIDFKTEQTLAKKFEYQIKDENHWLVKEDIGFMPELHIVGGGHVGLALSKIASELNFKIFIYDDRENLNTVAQNKFAQHIYIENYEKIGNYITNGQNKYVVLMSFGYRTDKVVLKQLLHHQFKYLGMMGSVEKVKQLFKELKAEGIDKKLIENVYSPIGVQIRSKTPAEIAISILAEVIGVKNEA